MLRMGNSFALKKYDVKYDLVIAARNEINDTVLMPPVRTLFAQDHELAMTVVNRRMYGSASPDAILHAGDTGGTCWDMIDRH